MHAPMTSYIYLIFFSTYMHVVNIGNIDICVHVMNGKLYTIGEYKYYFSGNSKTTT